MRFFNFVNFTNLLPSSNPTNVFRRNQPAVQESFTTTLSQAQDISNLDFNFNNLYTNPEASVLCTYTSPNTSLNLQTVNPLYTFAQAPEVLNYVTLESLNYTNSSALRSTET